MALFSKKQDTEVKTQDAPAAPTSAPKKAEKSSVKTVKDLSRVLLKPRVTEKATDLQQQSAYVFDISEKATKPQIIQAVREMYKVTPKKIRVVTIRPKARRNARTGRTGVQSGGRKAYVFLKKGDSITIA